MEVSSNNTNLRVVSRQSSQQPTSHKSSIERDMHDALAMNLVKEFIDDVLVFTEEEQLLYASDRVYKTLSRLQQDPFSEDAIPAEIWHVCQSLIQSRHRFPHQNWLIEFDILTQDATILHIRSRWLQMDTFDHACLLLIVEDRQQGIESILMEEAKQYGLTPREKEVWMLHRNDLTYKQIALELGITPNTVKKHMRSIHAKKKLSAPTKRQAS